MSFDGTAVRARALAQAPMEAAALCSAPNGNVCIVGHHSGFVSAIGVYDAAQESWGCVGRADVPGQFNGFSSAFANASGLFVAGQQFAKEPVVLSRTTADGWVGEKVNGGAALWQLGGDEKDVFGLLSDKAGRGGRVFIAQRDPATGEWHPLTSVPGDSAYRFACVGDELFVVGDVGVVHRYSRASNKWRSERLFPQASASCVSGTSGDDVYVAGKTRTELYFAHFDGTKWSDVFTGLAHEPRMVLGLVAVSRGVALAAGEPSGLYALRDGSRFEVLKKAPRSVSAIGS